ncbi:MAG: PA0069 family radical SAM protein [Rhodospirillales bacterium]|nr:PA0069 family radical SAM protein [Rhodospirillales bacterium]
MHEQAESPLRERDREAVATLEHAGAPEPELAVRRISVVRKGRGATGNPPLRFESREVESFDDGWAPAGEPEPTRPLATTLIRDQSCSAIAWNESPDIGFDRAVNPYRGCEHGCIYCYARPSHAYLGLSPGLDFETKIVFKPDLAYLLEREIRRPGYQVRPIALGSNTDPYQPVERRLLLTRAVLDLLDRTGHPLAIVTKSAGVVRDLEILARMAARNLARVHVSLTTLDAGLARRMEPRASAPARRLQAMAELARAGVPVGVMAAPMIPGLNDAELEKILEAAARNGARHAAFVLIRLPHELKEMFGEWLEQHVPGRARHVLGLVRQAREGRLNDPSFHGRMRGSGPYAELLAARFARAARSLGLAERPAELDCGQFIPPDKAPVTRQLVLL